MDYSQYKQLEFRRKFFKFFGAEIFIVDPLSGAEVGYIKMKAWKLREDVRVYTDRSMQRELIRIAARNIIDLGATYDVFDSATNQQLFSLKRNGLRSIFVRDHWDLLDTNGTPFGGIQETSGTLALLRRYLGAISDLIDLVFFFVKQTYRIYYGAPGGQESLGATIVHQKNPFVVKMSVDMTTATVQLDPRLVLASTALLSIIEANKNA